MSKFKVTQGLCKNLLNQIANGFNIWDREYLKKSKRKAQKNFSLKKRFLEKIDNFRESGFLCFTLCKAYLFFFFLSWSLFSHMDFNGVAVPPDLFAFSVLLDCKQCFMIYSLFDFL